MENAPFPDLDKMAKNCWGTSDVVTDVSPDITAVRWKNKTIVNAVYIRWKWTNPVCNKILQEREQTSWYWSAQHYKYIQQINGVSWLHGREYCSTHDQLMIKEVVVAPFLDLRHMLLSVMFSNYTAWEILTKGKKSRHTRI